MGRGCILLLLKKVDIWYNFFLSTLFRGKNETDDLFEQYTSLALDEEGESEIIYDQRKHNSGRPEGESLSLRN